jgi:hypothetical protein
MLQTGRSKLNKRTILDVLKASAWLKRLLIGLLIVTSTSLVLAQSPKPASKAQSGVRKPQMSDAIKANMYADNWFMLYVNGELIAVDSIAFVPHNVISSEPLPADWFAIAFDDSSWENAKEYTHEQVGPKQVFNDYDFEGAKFIWSSDIELDNVVIFRHLVPAPPDGKARADFSNLNNVVPEGPQRPPRGKR